MYINTWWDSIHKTEPDSDIQGKDKRQWFKAKYKEFHLNIRKKFYALRVTEHWSRLPKEAVDSPFLDIFKTQLDMALSILL